MLPVTSWLDTLFQGETFGERLLRSMGILWGGALVIYLLRGGWHQWPPPWPPATILLFGSILAIAAFAGCLVFHFTAPLRTSERAIARSFGRVFPISILFATMGLGLIWAFKSV